MYHALVDIWILCLVSCSPCLVPFRCMLVHACLQCAVSRVNQHVSHVLVDIGISVSSELSLVTEHVTCFVVGTWIPCFLGDLFMLRSVSVNHVWISLEALSPSLAWVDIRTPCLLALEALSPWWPCMSHALWLLLGTPCLLGLEALSPLSWLTLGHPAFWAICSCYVLCQLTVSGFP